MRLVKNAARVVGGGGGGGALETPRATAPNRFDKRLYFIHGLNNLTQCLHGALEHFVNLIAVERVCEREIARRFTHVPDFTVRRCEKGEISSECTCPRPLRSY